MLDQTAHFNGQALSTANNWNQPAHRRQRARCESGKGRRIEWDTAETDARRVPQPEYSENLSTSLEAHHAAESVAAGTHPGY
jgi:hypothetical protein